MKKRVVWLTVVLMTGLLVAFPGCKPKETEKEAKPFATESKGKAPVAEQPAETYWTCPMHPEVRQKGPGDCPKCGMKLVEKKAEAGEKAK